MRRFRPSQRTSPWWGQGGWAWVVAVSVGMVAPHSRADSGGEERVRKELEAQLQQLVGARPQGELELHFDGVDMGYRVERAAFSLDGVRVASFAGADARALAGRFFSQQGIAPGEHVLFAEVMFKEHAPGLFDYGLEFTVKSTVRFRTDDGLRVKLALRGVELGRQGTENRVKLSSEAHVELLAQVDPPLPPAPAPVAEVKAATGLVDAGTEAVELPRPTVAAVASPSQRPSSLPASALEREERVQSTHRAHLLLQAPERTLPEAPVGASAEPTAPPPPQAPDSSGVDAVAASPVSEPARVAVKDDATPLSPAPEVRVKTEAAPGVGPLGWGLVVLALVGGGLGVAQWRRARRRQGQGRPSP